MSDYILILGSVEKTADTQASEPEDWNVATRLAASLGDAIRILEEDTDDCRMLILDRESTDQLPQIVERFRRLKPGLEIVLLSPAVSEKVRGRYLALGLEWLDRSRPRAELLAEIHRRFQRSKFQARTGILGRSHRIHEIIETILHIGHSDIPVLVTGPSGAGKELVARACHQASGRSHKPFLAVNVGSLAESVLESELFGHEKGAFTGAVARKQGLFEAADGGTLFLDEVGEMSSHMQVRLLRVLESGEITPVGASRPMHVDVRLLAATNRPLEQDVRRGEFREDLFYRLKVVQIDVPALVERREDIRELAEYFLLEAKRQYTTQATRFSEDALRRLHEYHWPGNIRELRNVISSAAVLAKTDRVEESDLPDELLQPDSEAHLPVPSHRSRSEAERDILLQSLIALRQDIQEVLRILKEERRATRAPSSAVVVDGEVDAPELNLRNTEKEKIREALDAVDGNRRRAARRLGIAERTLYRKLKEYGLT